MTNETPDNVLRGSCLCGGVKYEISTGVGNISLCHCSMCRKAHGSAFGAYTSVSWPGFNFVSGENLVRKFRSSSDITRTFCSACGSTLQFIRDDRPGFGLAVGTLDSDPGRRPTAQIFAKDKAPWWDLLDEPPYFDTYPPEPDGDD